MLEQAERRCCDSWLWSIGKRASSGRQSEELNSENAGETAEPTIHVSLINQD
jgi:hypothetical protein